MTPTCRPHGRHLPGVRRPSVEHYADGAERFLRGAPHPTLRRVSTSPWLSCCATWRPGFTNYIASGGDRDFMWPVTHKLYAVPSTRVIGSSNVLQWIDDEDGGMVRYQTSPRSSTTGPSSGCGSGAASAGARSSRRATPT